MLIDWSAGALRRRLDATAAIERAGGRVAPAIYTHRADYRVALEQGQGVTEYQPWQAAAQEIRASGRGCATKLALTGNPRRREEGNDMARKPRRSRRSTSSARG